MNTLTLPLPLELRDRHPYFIFGRHEAEAEMRAALVEAYGRVHGRYGNTHMGGMVRWAEATENLTDSTERYGTKMVNRGGQRRLLWQGMEGEAAEIIVLRGQKGEDRFTTSERGIRSEEHSLLAETSFQVESGEPMTTGSYLFHDEGDEEGYFDAWFVAKGTTRKGWEYVLCNECIHLGRMRYLGGGGTVDPIDVQP